jgi:EAL domain-containing protein (putative c-di-GMP-specific phosphodiesterase class I)
MYKAKDQGRNQVQFHILGTYGAAIRRLTLETDLRHAFERDQLTLAYQPQFDCKTGRMVAAEALLRWSHPESGPISPAEFVPIAEDTGLILPIGEWVLMKACAEAKAWRNAGWRDAVVAVNVSPRQLTGLHLAEAVKKALAAAELPPDGLEIEVTEGSLMLNGNDALSFLLEIASLGVRIAVDDFGAGYSSLARLKKFPIGTLKIDRSFIMNLTSDDGDAAIVRAIIAMAKSLEVRTVAEGVETEAQFALLKAEGCELIQGFLFSRPITGDDLHRRITSGLMSAR